MSHDKAVRPWNFKHELEHLRKLLDEEIVYRKQLEALLMQNSIDPSLARSIKVDQKDEPGPSKHEQPTSPKFSLANLPPTFSLADAKRMVDELDNTDWGSNLAQTLRVAAQVFKPPKGVEVRLDHVTWSVRAPSHSQAIPTVGSQLLNILSKPVHMFCPPRNAVTKNILSDISGIFKPGQMTLILGRPGSGKTSLLKLMAHDTLVDKRHSLKGKVTYNGHEPGPTSFNAKRVIGYIDQHDSHFANLTVEETINLAFELQDHVHKLIGANPNDPINLIRRVMSDRKIKVNQLLKMFGLDHVRETLVGDELVRGVSGGQKKRVTLCEMIVGFYRVILGDQISTGLDSSTTYDISKTIRAATTELKLTTAISLLQPPPEVFQLFDQVVLLDEGQVVYMGPVSSVLLHFSQLGFECPEHHDTADFLQEITTTEESRKFWNESRSNSGVMPGSTKTLVTAYHNTDVYRSQQTELAQPAVEAEWRSEQQTTFLQSWSHSTRLIVKRQFLLTRRNKKLVRAQVGQGLMMGLLIGSLFYQLNIDQYSNRYGLFFLTSMIMALGAMPTLPIMCRDRVIFYRQRDAAFYPTSSFVFAQAVASLPVNMVQTMVFGTLMWWMCGLTDEGHGGSWGVYIIVAFCLSVAVAQVLRSIAAIAPTANTATPIAGFFIVLMILFSGFIVRENDIPQYWIWVFWLNPIAWSIRAFALIEFTSDKYAATVKGGGTLGELYLDAYGFRKDPSWIWGAVLYLVGLFVFSLMVTYFGLEKLRQGGKPKPPDYGTVEAEGAAGQSSELRDVAGQVRTSAEAKDVVTAGDGDLDNVDPEAEAKSVMPFTPVILTFENVWYTVRVSSRTHAHHTEKLDLLQAVTGFARPGSLTALMGSSGAGKTTLLDVISGRKTSGHIRGDIRVNGHKKDKSFARLSGYVEQMDIHSPHSTVLESLMFSARLRLPASVARDVRHRFVHETMSLLELDALKHSLVGKDGDGLSTEQRKRLTIGVELVANPSVLFLDEPTSGLDSRAAAIVMRVIRNISATKRTVICTIHQPSAVLFEMFDNLLLLKKGGKTVYFGPLGDQSKNMISYLRALPGAPAIKPNANPATYMLEVIGAGTSGATSLIGDAADLYANSALKVVTDAELAQLKTATQPAFTFDDKYATPLRIQAKALITKSFKNYWRSPNYNVTRMLVSTGVALVFGSVYKRRPIETQADVISRFSIMFIASTFTSVVYMTSVIETVATERAVFNRERAANMYAAMPYAASFTLAEIPYLVFNTLVFSVVFYTTVGLYDSWEKFGYFWLYYMLMIGNATFAGQMFATLAPDSQSATVMGTLTMNVWTSFSGFMLSPGDIPSYWSFMYWLSPLHYLMEGMVVTQFHGENQKIVVTTGSGRAKMTVEQYTETHFGGNFLYEHRGQDIIALIAFIVGFNITRTLALQYLNMVRR